MFLANSPVSFAADVNILLVTPQGAPILDGRVEAWGLADEDSAYEFSHAHDGEFRLTLTPGIYRITASAWGFGSYVGTVAVDTAPVTVRIALVDSSSPMGSLRGRVLSNDTSSQRRWVELESIHEVAWSIRGRTSEAIGDEGRFMFPELRQGLYVLLVYSEQIGSTDAFGMTEVTHRLLKAQVVNVVGDSDVLVPLDKP